MKTIRRIYIYLVAFISFELTAWAIIGLVRSIFDTTSIGGNTADLAQALSMIVVGGVVFGIHWRMAQKDAAEDPKERLSTVRAIFFYALWASLIGPVVQNLLAIIYRGLSAIFDVPINSYAFAGNQIASDNIIAVVVNIGLATYIFSLMKNHWKSEPDVDAFKTVRRIFRYAWMLYALGMTLAGIQQLLSYLFGGFGTIGFGATRTLVWGISYLLIGLPLWINIWQLIVDSLKDSGERESLLRQIILYIITLLGAILFLFVFGILANEFLQTIFISKVRFSDFFSRVVEAVAILVPALLTWIYFNRVLKQDRAADPHITRRSGMRRLYIYILSFLGILTTFIGLEILVVFIADVLFGDNYLVGNGWINELINIFVLLAIGIPVWLRHWLPMNSEAAEQSEAGDHARRSLNRKGYLYIILFLGVIGIMFIAGSLLFLIISTVLGDPPDNLATFLTQVLGSLVFVTMLTMYHWQQLRADNSKSSVSLSAQHAEFSVLILESGEEEFTARLLKEFKEEVPSMPVSVQAIGNKFAENAESVDAVLFRSSLLTSPTKEISDWLTKFEGTRVIIPDETDHWVWVGLSGGNEEKWIKNAVQSIEKISEKQVFSLSGRSPWIYVLLGLFGLPLLCGLINFIAENAF